MLVLTPTTGVLFLIRGILTYSQCKNLARRQLRAEDEEEESEPSSATPASTEATPTPTATAAV